jgi:hypothetical protein
MKSKQPKLTPSLTKAIKKPTKFISYHASTNYKFLVPRIQVLLTNWIDPMTGKKIQYVFMEIRFVFSQFIDFNNMLHVLMLLCMFLKEIKKVTGIFLQ